MAGLFVQVPREKLPKRRRRSAEEGLGCLKKSDNTIGRAGFPTSNGPANPQAINHPLFSISVTQKNDIEDNHNCDWLCLLFISPEFPISDLETILSDHPYPSDYTTPIQPDFLFFPVALLSWQVRLIAESIDGINESMVDILTGTNPSSDAIQELNTIRTTLFNFRREHLSLTRRHMFAMDFAAQIELCFNEIETRNSKSGQSVKYCPTLRRTVGIETAKLKALLHDLETIPKRLEAQQTSVCTLLIHIKIVCCSSLTS